jgi:hypothetical protein
LIGKPLNPDYKAKLDRYLKKHQLKNVEIIGQIPHDRIPENLEAAHLFTSASTMEVQSLVVIEALASGTPVVGLSNETIDELINDEVGAWLARNQEPAEFAEQIEAICTLPEEQYRQMCHNARDRVAQLDWSRVVEKTTLAYREILTIKLFLSEDESDMLNSLVRFFTLGEVRGYLLSVISDARERVSEERGFLPRFKVPEWLQTWLRVPSSTWILSGLTIVISVVGFLFLRGRGEKDSPDGGEK